VLFNQRYWGTFGQKNGWSMEIKTVGFSHQSSMTKKRHSGSICIKDEFGIWLEKPKRIKQKFIIEFLGNLPLLVVHPLPLIIPITTKSHKSKIWIPLSLSWMMRFILFFLPEILVYSQRPPLSCHIWFFKTLVSCSRNLIIFWFLWFQKWITQKSLVIFIWLVYGTHSTKL